MEVLELIDMLEDVVDKAGGIPLIGKAIVDRDELLDLIEEIRINLPDDLKQAKWVKDERQRILDDASKEAATIIKLAEEKMASLIDDHEITQRAQAQAGEIVGAAQANARDIRQSTKQYVDDHMAALEAKIERTLMTVREHRNELKNK